MHMAKQGHEHSPNILCLTCLPHVYNAHKFMPCIWNDWVVRDRARLFLAALLCRPICSRYVPCSLVCSILRREVDLTPLEKRICIPPTVLFLRW